MSQVVDELEVNEILDFLVEEDVGGLHRHPGQVQVELFVLGERFRRHEVKDVAVDQRLDGLVADEDLHLPLVVDVDQR